MNAEPGRRANTSCVPDTCYTTGPSKRYKDIILGRKLPLRRLACDLAHIHPRYLLESALGQVLRLLLPRKVEKTNSTRRSDDGDVHLVIWATTSSQERYAEIDWNVSRMT
jgi:hypothetical protein